MEEIYSYIFRAAFAILSIAGVLWGAVNVLIKYKMLHVKVVVQEYIDGKAVEMRNSIAEQGNAIYELQDAISICGQNHDRLLENLQVVQDQASVAESTTDSLASRISCLEERISRLEKG